MHPELIHQIVLERTARLQRDADRHRQAREARNRPARPARSAIELLLSACRAELERLACRWGAAGRSAE